MKYILAALFSVFLLATTVPTAQAQTALPICHQKSALLWEMNEEADMLKYVIYVSNNPIDVEVDNAALALMEVAHDPATAVDDGAGNLTIKEAMTFTLSEGDKYFRVSAIDKVGNESGMSNEASCTYDKIPNTPRGVNVVLQFKKRK